MQRIAVKYKNIPLMPMKALRAREFIKSKKGVIKYDRKLQIHYLQLLVEPSGYATQDVVLGIDPGSSFDGFSVVSADTHHCNFELIHRAKKGATSIKKLLERKAMNRRLRRSRLRHRDIRFNNRTSSKLAPTIRSMIDYRKWLITKLAAIYPISLVVVEDVAFNHFISNKGSSFSQAEQGKTELYNFISAKFRLRKMKGHETYLLRQLIFGIDPKLKDKDSISFYAHCVDSFVLAHCLSRTIKYPKLAKINEKVKFIEKNVRRRRCLTKLRPKHYNNHKSNNSYYRLLKGGIRVNYENISRKRNICRVKPNGIHSNHPKEWIYLDLGYAIKKKSKIQLYGGTKKSRDRLFKNNEYHNRKIFTQFKEKQ